MRRVVRFRPKKTLPGRCRLLARAGLPEGRAPSARHAGLLDEAIALYLAEAAPIGLGDDVGRDELLAIVGGAGAAAPPVVASVASCASRLALFAATVGEPVAERIQRLFASGEAPLGFFLDAVASEAAALLPDLVGETLEEGGGPGGPVAYSPGYCGWPLAGQKALFARLAPSEVGIALGASALMAPLKSVSGALVWGPPASQRAPGRFEACAACPEPSCEEGRWTS